MTSPAKHAVDLDALSAKVGQLIRTNELKMAGKLLATARGHLHQLAESDRAFQPRYEHVADLRNELMEPDREDFDEKQLLAHVLDEEKELHRMSTLHRIEPVMVSQTLLRSAAAIILVYAQDQASGAPLDF
jgi:hypothetical protein